MSFIDNIKKNFTEGSTLTKLIYINIGLFLILKILDLFYSFSGEYNFFTKWLAVPSNLELLLYKPWTPITYMFLHWGFVHLIFNLIGLYWFGLLFLQRFEGQKLLSVYVLGGIAGAVLYLLVYCFVPRFQTYQALLLGASASVIAILVAIAIYEPNKIIRLAFIGEVPLKYIAIFYVLLSVIGVSSTNAGGNISHLGGALWGWIFINQLGKGRDLGAWIPNFLDFKVPSFKRRARMKVNRNEKPNSDYEYNRQKNHEQDEINQILDKISKKGYESLSKREKEILFKQGK